MSWNLEPPDPIEPKEVLTEVCSGCFGIEDCLDSCARIFPGITVWIWICQGCGVKGLCSDNSWESHECDILEYRNQFEDYY
jgi:hypothetical protein